MNKLDADLSLPEDVRTTLDRLLDPDKKTFLGIIGIQGDGKSTWMNRIGTLYSHIFRKEQLLDLDKVYDASERRELDDRAKRLACVEAIYDCASKGSFVVELLPMHDMDGYLSFLQQKGFQNLGVLYPIGGSVEENIQRVLQRKGASQFPESEWRTWIQKMNIEARKSYPRLLESTTLDFALVIDNSNNTEGRILLEFNRGRLVGGIKSLPAWVKQRLSPPSREELSWMTLQMGLPRFPSIHEVIRTTREEEEREAFH